MTTILQPDEAGDVDFALPRQKYAQDRIACFLHLRDLVYTHPRAASAVAVAVVQTLEAAVIAERDAREKRFADAREKRLADARERARREADRQKAAEQAIAFYG